MSKKRTVQRKIIWHGKELRVSLSDKLNQPCDTKINEAKRVYSSGQCNCMWDRKAPFKSTQTATEGGILTEKILMCLKEVRCFTC